MRQSERPRLSSVGLPGGVALTIGGLFSENVT